MNTISKRTFYKTTITVEVLSEEPLEYDDLEDVNYLITQGDCSGKITDEQTEKVDAPTIAKLLQEQGSDPQLFQIDPFGNDL